MMISAWKEMNKMRNSVSRGVRSRTFWIMLSGKTSQGGIFKLKPEDRTEARTISEVCSKELNH